MTHNHDGMITNVGKLPRPAIDPPQPKQSLWARLMARLAVPFVGRKVKS